MKTKRLLTGILAVVLVLTAICFVACDEKPVVQEVTDLTLPTLGENQMAVIVKNGEKDYTNIVVTLGEHGVDAKTGEDVIAYLAEQGALTVDWTDSDYGKMINGIGSLKPDATKKEFVTVLTSVAKDHGTWAGVTTYMVGNVKLVSSAVGISSMTVESGAIIYFEIQTY